MKIVLGNVYCLGFGRVFYRRFLLVLFFLSLSPSLLIAEKINFPADTLEKNICGRRVARREPTVNMKRRFWRGFAALFTLGSVRDQMRTMRSIHHDGLPVRVLDSGGGLSVTGLHLAKKYGFEVSNVDLKNYYRAFLLMPALSANGVEIFYDPNRNIRHLSQLPAEALIRLTEILKVPLPAGLSYDARRREPLAEDLAERVIKVSSSLSTTDLKDKLKALYLEILDRVDEIPNFLNYRTSLQEFCNSRSDSRFHLIIDRYASFDLSYDRSEILRYYYEHLTGNGLAIVRAGVPGNLFIEPLMEAFPTVFSKEHGAILIRRDPRFTARDIFPVRRWPAQFVSDSPTIGEPESDAPIMDEMEN